MINLRISFIQSSVHWENKAENLEMFRKKIETVPEKTALIILPEMFSTGFSMNKTELAETNEGITVEWMRKMAALKGAIVTGSIIAKEEKDGETAYFNRLIWMLPTGEFGIYDKRHLFAFGKEDQHYSPGKKRLIASVSGWRVNLQICYDLRFPVWARQNISRDSQTTPEYDLLLFAANWPSSRIHAWRTLLQARAIENQCYVVGLNRTGQDGKGILYSGSSMIIGPLGEIIQEMGAEEAIGSHTLDREKLEEVRRTFPFWRDADAFNIQL
jgi:omega-amidase